MELSPQQHMLHSFFTINPDCSSHESRNKQFKNLIIISVQKKMSQTDIAAQVNRVLVELREQA